MKVIFFKDQEKQGWAATDALTGQLVFSSDIDGQLKATLEAVAAERPLVPVSMHPQPRLTAVVFVPSDPHSSKFLELLASEVAARGYVGNIVDESVDSQLIALLECLPATHQARLQATANMDRMSILEKTTLIELLEEQFNIVSE